MLVCLCLEMTKKSALIEMSDEEADEIKETIRKCTTCPSLLDDSQPAWARQCIDCFKDDNTRRPCVVCEKPRIDVSEPEWKKVCGSCFKDAAMKPCQGCKEFKIKAFETWRTLCKDCWVDRAKYLRICTVCNDRPLKSGVPDWVTTCTKCFIDAKKLTHELCPTCTGKNATLLRKRKRAPACRECMSAQGLIRSVQQYMKPVC